MNPHGIVFRRSATALATAAVVLAAACRGGAPRETPPASPESHADIVQRWRAKHEADYRRDFVTIAGLHPLKPGGNTAGSAPTNDIVLPASTPAMLGRFVLDGQKVRFEPAPAASRLVTLNNQPVVAAIDLRDDRETVRDELVVGDVRMVVHVSGDRRSIRVRDPNGPLAKGFHGFSWFQIDPQYRVVGRFIKDAQPQRVKVLNTFGDIDEYSTEGVVEFRLLGQTLRLRPFTTRPKRFYIVFKDASSGQETYEAARFLYADLLDDGTAVLDFNQAYNPPCAFNPYTTCPIPLRENNLPVRILAGEKAYPVPVATFGAATGAAQPGPMVLDVRMSAPPPWASLQRQLLDANLPACREFFNKYYDDRGYLQAFVRWGANDGPDDAFENFNRWPELHALGADDEILRLYLKAWEGMTRQYSEARTRDVPAGRAGMYVNDFSAQSDWMHHGEGLQLFNRLALSSPDLPAYQDRARRFAALYMGEAPGAPNYDPKLRLIRSMINGSIGPMLRKATALDWVGDPFDTTGFVALHGENSYKQFLEHYEEYTDVSGDHFLNLVATTLPTNAYLLTGDAKYRAWIVDYMDAWLARMKQNGGIIPSFVDLDGRVGGPDGRWWGNAYGWGFSPVNPVTGRRENRNRIPRALVGFSNALLVTGDRKYVDAWRDMMAAVNANARTVDGSQEYPTMFGASGWYGWQREPWSVGALDVWYWSMRAEDRARVGSNAWVEFLEGKDSRYPETALRRELESIPRKVTAIRADKTPAGKRLADNMLDMNPAATDALVRLMLGALVPGREGGLLNARLRYFDPVRRRAGVPQDVAALVTELGDRETRVTLVNLGTIARDVVVQAGAYAEHQIESVEYDSRQVRVDAPHFTVRIAPGSAGQLRIAMRRYVNKPTVAFPWQRK